MLENVCGRNALLQTMPEQASFVHQKIHAGGVQDIEFRTVPWGRKKKETRLLKKYLHFRNGSFIISLASSIGDEGKRKARLAQLVEHLTLNQGVQGSSP